jgi:transcriptional regulator with XRE-family HTH domain
MYLKELKEEHGLSIRKIERLTGINRGIVLKA